jgi:hypothetical protein
MSEYKKNIVRIELIEEKSEEIIKSKRHNYVRGGYKTEETIFRSVRVTPHAVLECGHLIEESGSGKPLNQLSRIYCYQCYYSDMAKTKELIKDQ